MGKVKEEGDIIQLTPANWYQFPMGKVKKEAGVELE